MHSVVENFTGRFKNYFLTVGGRVVDGVLERLNRAVFLCDRVVGGGTSAVTSAEVRTQAPIVSHGWYDWPTFLKEPLRGERPLRAQTVRAAGLLWLGRTVAGGCGTRPEGPLSAGLFTAIPISEQGAEVDKQAAGSETQSAEVDKQADGSETQGAEVNKQADGSETQGAEVEQQPAGFETQDSDVDQQPAGT